MAKKPRSSIHMLTSIGGLAKLSLYQTLLGAQDHHRLSCMGIRSAADGIESAMVNSWLTWRDMAADVLRVHNIILVVG
jgi:hypothetical protein